MTKIPGLKTAHQLITPTCRANRGREGAFDEAVTRIRATYATYAGETENDGVTWHLVLMRDEGGLS